MTYSREKSPKEQLLEAAREIGALRREGKQPSVEQIERLLVACTLYRVVPQNTRKKQSEALTRAWASLRENEGSEGGEP